MSDDANLTGPPIIDMAALQRCVVRFGLAMREILDHHDSGDDSDYHIIARNALEYASEQLKGD